MPDGTTDVLLRIPDWDFNWQGDYRFANPPRLPKGTTLVQRFSYDNSPANVRNPNSPPQRVRYGLQSVDEMGELWLQVIPLTAQGRETLLRDFGRRALLEIAANSRRALRTDPDNVKALIDLGKVTLALESPTAAVPLLRRAVQSDPDSATAHYYLGHALLASGDLSEAQTAIGHRPAAGRRLSNGLARSGPDLHATRSAAVGRGVVSQVAVAERLPRHVAQQSRLGATQAEQAVRGHRDAGARPSNSAPRSALTRALAESSSNPSTTDTLTTRRRATDPNRLM